MLKNTQRFQGWVDTNKLRWSLGKIPRKSIKSLPLFIYLCFDSLIYIFIYLSIYVFIYPVEWEVHIRMPQLTFIEPYNDRSRQEFYDWEDRSCNWVSRWLYWIRALTGCPSKQYVKSPSTSIWLVNTTRFTWRRYSMETLSALPGFLWGKSRRIPLTKDGNAGFYVFLILA